MILEFIIISGLFIIGVHETYKAIKNAPYIDDDPKK